MNGNMNGNMNGIKKIRFFLTVLIGISSVYACSSNEKRVAFPYFIVFRTDDASRPVKGRLFYKQIKDINKHTVIIQGDLIFMNLKGWHTKEPVPLYSYRRNDRQLTDLDKDKPVTVYSYLAGNANSICSIPVTLIIRDVNIKKFDLEKLTLEYLNESIQDNILLSSDTLTNRQYFKVSYNLQPINIEHFKLTERQGLNIRHSIEIQAVFPRIVEEKESLLKQT